MSWKVKCVIDTCKSLMPFEAHLRSAKHRFVGYSSDLSVDSWTIQQGLVQVQWVRSEYTLEWAAVLEIGSGWS